MAIVEKANIFSLILRLKTIAIYSDNLWENLNLVCYNSNISNTSTLLFLIASWTGNPPNLSRVFWAPLLISHSTISQLPSEAAKCKGVLKS